MSKQEEHELLLREAEKIVRGLGQSLSPLCEIVLHSLSGPDQGVIAIENSISGRKVGDSTTELGVARMVNSDFPEILANYENQFPDGRPAKSTSIGIKDSEGQFIAAICLNMDVSYLKSISSYLGNLAQIDAADRPSETLAPGQTSLEARVLEYSSQLNKAPSSLSSNERRTLAISLEEDGLFDQRGTADKLASLLGCSRSNIYYYLRNK